MVFRHLFPIIGHRPINKLRPIEVLQVCQIKEKEGKYTFAKKERLAISKVLQYAVATTRAERDVTQDITGALQTGSKWKIRPFTWIPFYIGNCRVTHLIHHR
jgi:hypothetical protein